MDKIGLPILYPWRKDQQTLFGYQDWRGRGEGPAAAPSCFVVVLEGWWERFKPSRQRKAKYKA
jgi:hypothetical protein